jgi:hypothetical protein
MSPSCGSTVKERKAKRKVAKRFLTNRKRKSKGRKGEREKGTEKDSKSYAQIIVGFSDITV